MLIKITESCSLGCTHCLNDAKPNGRDMTVETLIDALTFIRDIGDYASIIVTGGEPTEHENFEAIIDAIVDFYEASYKSGSMIGHSEIIITTNGFWILEHVEAAKAIVAKGTAKNIFEEGFSISFQVSTDAKYYPKKLDVTKSIWREDGFILCTDCVQIINPQGRAKENGIPTDKKFSNCFNVRAVAKQLVSAWAGAENVTLTTVIDHMRKSSKFCTPGIKVDGSIILGESDLCPSIGTVQDDPASIVKAIVDFTCNGCPTLNKEIPIALQTYFQKGI